MFNIIHNLFKKFLALFPPTWPSKIYNILIKISFLKYIINLTVRGLTPESIDIPEGKIIFDKNDPVMSGYISLGKYEPETVAFFRSCLKENMTVVDIGANLGYFTVIAARKVGPLGKIFSYEPDPHNFALLEKNIATNKFENVTAIPIALSDRVGRRELFFGDNQCTHSFGDKKGNGEFEFVATDTLDNSLKSINCSKVDIIKMDIEGAEPIVLEGMRETITKNSNLIILFELYPNAIKRLGNSPLEFLEKLREFGFSISVLDEDDYTNEIINDLNAFLESFPKKDLSKNLVAIKN